MSRGGHTAHQIIENALCDIYAEISDLANSTDEPVFITKDGDGDLVLLSMRAYEKLSKLESDQRFIDREKFVNEQRTTIDTRRRNTTEYELGSKLKSMYDNAPRGDQVAFIYLFGLVYADVLLNERPSKREILKMQVFPNRIKPKYRRALSWHNTLL